MRITTITALLISTASLLYLLFGFSTPLQYAFITPDQKGYALFEDANYSEAAEHFEDQHFKGVALFKDGEFKKAHETLRTQSSKTGRFNYANALFMNGQYEKAIASYELALKIDPEFKEAKENLELSKARLHEIRKHRDNDEGTGGKLAADEVQYDNKNNRGQEYEEHSAGEISQQPTSQWLDRLETSPKTFLENKFAYQYRVQGASDAP